MVLRLGDFMEIIIRGTNISVTKAIKEYVEDKLKRLDKYFEKEKNIKANVVIRLRGEEAKVEVTIPTNRFTLRAEVSHKDLYAAIDLVIDILERQIRKNKTKLNNKYKNVIQLDINTDFEVKEENIKIVKRKNIDTKPMDEEEAILQMELLNHDFFVFKNVDEECVSVIYKREDGNYGIINVK